MPDPSVDTVEPGDRWAFDATVAASFADMLCRSIPDYHAMRRLTFEVGKEFVTRGTDIVDLGCSRGDGIAAFWRHFGACNRYILGDVSAPMLAIARQTYACAIANGLVQVREMDLRKPLPHIRPSLTMAVLTLQFVPIEHRQRLVGDVYRATEPGGAFLVVEKVLGRGEAADGLLVRLHHDRKLLAGYPREAIDRKRASLEGVLVPVTAAWNEDLLRRAGFGTVECVWRCLNFAAWVAVKSPQ